MGSTICTAGFPSAAIASSCFTARCDSIWYGFFIATLLFLGKRNCSQPIKGFERGSRYFLRSTGHSLMDSTTAPRAVKIRPESLLIQERRDLGFDFPLFYKKTIHPADCFHLLGRTGYQDNTVRLNADRKSTRLNSSHANISYA